MNLTPFLLFDGRCAEAMAFYQACLGGELGVTQLDDLREMPFGVYGHLADRFGVHWFFRGGKGAG